MSEISTKPYLLRAIYEWCTDNGYTPYIAAMVDAYTHAPREFVKNNEIVLNISFNATTGLKMENDLISFHARFGGVSRNISIPVDNVVAIYARENGQGMAFEVTKSSAAQIDFSEENSDNSISPPILSSVPSLKADHSNNEDADNHDNDPEPPKKGGRPTLTRIK